MSTYDVIVVGAGVMGAATARATAGQGKRTLLLEQFAVGHTRGSSHGRSRIFRFSYPDRRYVRMAMEALPLWRELERDSGTSLLRTTGGLDRGKPLDEHVAALSSCDATFEVLEGSEVARRWPGLRVDPDDSLLYQPDGGVVAAEHAVEAFVKCAQQNGAELRERTRVTSIRPRADGVELETSGDPVTTPVAIVTAGAWARGLLADAGIELRTRVTRETVAYFEAPEDVPTLVEWGEPSRYALVSPGQGIKAGEHTAGPTTDPDARGAPDLQSVARLKEWVAERFPSATPEPHLAETCLYTNTSDEHFVLERRGPIVVGSPCSGHGFKFAPWIGRRLAELAATEDVPA